MLVRRKENKRESEQREEPFLFLVFPPSPPLTTLFSFFILSLFPSLSSSPTLPYLVPDGRVLGLSPFPQSFRLAGPVPRPWA